MKDANEKPGPKQNSLVRPKRLPETPVPPIPKVDETSELASTQYSAYRTGLSNHRTGLSEHRTSLSEYRTDLSTLMSVIRTSLSLIGFGFTIFQFFQRLRDAGTIVHAAAPRNFGLALVALGIVMLVIGIVYHVQFMLGLRHERDAMHQDGLIHAQSGFPPSMTLVTALILLVVGVLAIVSMLFQVEPFG